MLSWRISRTSALQALTLALLAAVCAPSSASWAQASGNCDKIIQNASYNGAAGQIDAVFKNQQKMGPDNPSRDNPEKSLEEPMRTNSPDDDSASNGDPKNFWAQTGDSDTMNNQRTDIVDANAMETNLNNEVPQMGEKAYQPSGSTSGCPANSPPPEMPYNT